MCGIAGILHRDGHGAEPVLVQRMGAALAHRGPDGAGEYVDGPVGLAHRRLAIIDLSPAGHQPMATADGRFVLTYNGEIYNFPALRAELQAHGHQFRSRTDSEVVLHAWSAWGPACLPRFNGMFAFALWDARERSLFLARDRYGIKPLYYAAEAHTFAFGSEQRAILARPGFRRTLNVRALLEYFTFQNIFTDQTLLQNVHLLPPGHYVSVKADGSAPQLCRYWDYRFEEPERVGSREEYIEELDRLFRQAVNRQLVSDVELGAYLSGGMDSGSITAIATKSFPNLKTFTCGFDLSSASGIEMGFDERPRAEAMSALFRTEHYEMVLKAGDMERSLPAVAWHLEEPRVGQSYPNYYAAKLTSRFVKVVLSGTGGDELFGGYPWRYYRAATSQGFDHYIDQYYAYWQRLLTSEDLAAVFRPVWTDVSDVCTRSIFRGVFANHENALERPEDYINHSLYFEARTFLHGLFVVEDKLSMAHGLESRVPFMDNDLVDFAMRCPVGLKLNNLAQALRINENEPGSKVRSYFQRTNDGKQILRDMMTRHIPLEVTQAEKQGFSSPDASWFKGESIKFVQSVLLDRNARLYDVLDRRATGRLVAEHLNGERNRRLLIWSLLNVESWMQQCL